MDLIEVGDAAAKLDALMPGGIFAKMRVMSEINVPVSPGELLDKITILRIKSSRMSDAAKARQRAHRTASVLEETWSASAYAKADIAADVNALLQVNERLWVIEDDIRDKERAQAFDAEFIRLARAVYFENDERAAIKRRINIKLGSTHRRGEILRRIQEPEAWCSLQVGFRRDVRMPGALRLSVYSAPQ